MEDKEFLDLILKISDGDAGECPKECPNIKNKPRYEGCGLSTCLEQVYLLVRSHIGKAN